VNLPLGFRYAATYAGIRKTKKDDLGLIASDVPAAAAAVFTKNRVQAAPVRIGKAHLDAGGVLRAIVVNAGNANCATRTGEKVAVATCKAAAKLLRAKVSEILPSSTGVIGVELDAKLILDALPRLVESLSPDGFASVAEAIMTTDTFPKFARAEASLDQGVVRIAGMTKGAGMIHPNMATTLGFYMTDAAAPAPLLRRMLAVAVEESYHRISVDGDTSTNDTVVLMANGASGVRVTARDREILQRALTHLMQDLACRIVRDGEGAKKLVTIHVRGAASPGAAAQIARAIAISPLVKTAVAGADPNWGRVLSAAGNAGVAFDPASVTIAMQGVTVCRHGVAAPFDEAGLIERLKERECQIDFAIRGGGTGEARFWTCDFTEGYIEVNASYRT
jgi:glutamate N-acetyltransferase/amino-acid N-acetyltransferase